MRIAFYIECRPKGRFGLLRTFHSWQEIMLHHHNRQLWNSQNGHKKQYLIVHIPGATAYPDVLIAQDY